MRSRSKSILACLLIIAMMTALFISYGYEKTWRLWNIPVMSPNFADLRVITAGATSYADGFDPLVNNPSDPWHRPLNYPRIWQALFLADLDQSHTTPLAIVIIALFLCGTCLLLPRVDNRTILFVAAALLSPATLLGIERCNIDLLMYFIVAIAIFVSQRSTATANSIIALGLVLKLYPILSGVIILKSKKTTFFKVAAALTAFTVIYLFITYSDLIKIRDATPKAVEMSYGVNVLWMRVSTTQFSQFAIFLKGASYLAIGFVMLWPVYILMNSRSSDQPIESIFLDSFRAGSAIYIGTFLLGNNFEYRLVFLMMTLPQLVSWARGGNGIGARVSRCTLIAVLTMMWALAIERLLGATVTFYLSEVAHWSAFVTLIYLFTTALPFWMKDCFTRRSLVLPRN